MFPPLSQFTARFRHYKLNKRNIFVYLIGVTFFFFFLSLLNNSQLADQEESQKGLIVDYPTINSSVSFLKPMDFRYSSTSPSPSPLLASHPSPRFIPPSPSHTSEKVRDSVQKSQIAVNLLHDIQAREKANFPQERIQSLRLTVQTVVGDYPQAPQAPRIDDHYQSRREETRQAFLHAWKGYTQYAWGQDELKPNSLSFHNWMGSDGLALTIIDSLDTLLLLDLPEEFLKARDWIEKHWEGITGGYVSVFETTIRILGSLLSSYTLTGDTLFLDRAKSLGEKLLSSFDPTSAVPFTEIDLKNGKAQNPYWDPERSRLADVGSIQLEFSYLSILTSNDTFAEKSLRVLKTLSNQKFEKKGLYPLYIETKSGKFKSKELSLGSLGDSFYEYLLKLWLLSGKRLGKNRDMFEESMKGVIDNLLFLTPNESLLYVARIDENGDLVHQMDHYTCFLPGVFSLAWKSMQEGTSPLDPQEKKDLRSRFLSLSLEMMTTCFEMYKRQKTGLAPDAVHFKGKDAVKYSSSKQNPTRKLSQNRPGQGDIGISLKEKFHLLRPEVVESLFVMYRMTGNQLYREWGWKIFTSIKKHCMNKVGFSGIKDVMAEDKDVVRDNLQPAYFLAETLKYLYLLFSPPSFVPMTRFVFNTEGHPFSISSSPEDIERWKNYLSYLE